ncbi:hypothetical protein BWQ96_00201 [Gracilariopsis chorda]|uniref:DNA methylase N-4/N-6 domain-containing protein n=1 Tax=Gracilariopsis chorda TaxID=448386 RepID=A0A2V3J6I8_9FLOR|nr:hypothetical protein BWQ96_00201 [Gracilariopsis chorda]|eukprot:PXF50041.1 hypothetical protein BWQ96_00201 [Gracilariopsis chorda]
MNQVLPMSKSEMLMWSVKNPSGKYTRKRVRPEPKCRALFKELIYRLSQPENLVVDMFFWMFSTAMACMELPKHRRFVGCEPDKARFEHARHAAIVRFAYIIREGHKDIEKSQELRKMARCVSSAFPMRRSRQTVIWRAVDGFPPYQILPLHLDDFFSTLWQIEILVKLGRKKPLVGWPKELPGRMNLENMKSLLAIEAVKYGLRVGKSTIRHEKAGVGVFATRRTAAGELVCYF